MQLTTTQRATLKAFVEATPALKTPARRPRSSRSSGNSIVVFIWAAHTCDMDYMVAVKR